MTGGVQARPTETFVRTSRISVTVFQSRPGRWMEFWPRAGRWPHKILAMLRRKASEFSIPRVDEDHLLLLPWHDGGEALAIIS